MTRSEIWEGPKEGREGGVPGARGSGLRSSPSSSSCLLRSRARLQWEGASGCDGFFLTT